MKYLVFGGRNYGTATDADPKAVQDRAKKERTHLYAVLRCIITEDDILIHGAAPGADSHAGMWAAANHVPCRAYPADWNTHGVAAGPIRNQQMLTTEQPNLCIGFPGGRGSANMAKLAHAAGVPVVLVQNC